MSLIEGKTLREVHAELLRSFRKYRQEHGAAIFSNWPFRTLQGKSRNEILARLMVALRDRGSRICRELWQTWEKFQQDDMDKEATSKRVWEMLAKSKLPA